MTAPIRRAPDRPAISPHPHISRLGAGLTALGGAGVVHAIWGMCVDPLLLAVGIFGLVWALWARHTTGMLAGTVLVAMALFALLDDHGTFTGAADALTLLALAAIVVLAHGLPVLRGDAWPLLPAGVLAFLAAFALTRLVVIWAGVPWTYLASACVLAAGLALLAWDARGGRAP